MLHGTGKIALLKLIKAYIAYTISIILYCAIIPFLNSV